ncbi:hypothetical protein GGR09_001137 [Bartonella heixiaziensis]
MLIIKKLRKNIAQISHKNIHEMIGSTLSKSLHHLKWKRWRINERLMLEHAISVVKRIKAVVENLSPCYFFQ